MKFAENRQLMHKKRHRRMEVMPFPSRARCGRISVKPNSLGACVPGCGSGQSRGAILMSHRSIGMPEGSSGSTSRLSPGM
jgi:hypothetical protein